MESRLVYCPDRECRVRMIWDRIPPEERSATRPGPIDIVCLDADGCTGDVCTLFSVATVRMRDRLRRFTDPRPWDHTG